MFKILGLYGNFFYLFLAIYFSFVEKVFPISFVYIKFSQKKDIYKKEKNYPFVEKILPYRRCTNEI